MPELKDSGLYGPPAQPERAREPDSPRLGSLLRRLPDWDRAVIGELQSEFLGWLKFMRVPVISVTRMSDSSLSHSRYALVQPAADGDVGRYQVVIAYQESDESWILGPPRPNMDVRAALELVARLVAESA